MTLRAGMYARVSTREQVDEGHSIAAQLHSMHAYCQSMGWNAIEFVDEGISASKESADRPAFRQLLADVEARRIDVVVVHKLDRFSRQLMVTMQGLARISRAGAAFVSLSEHIDMSTPSGRLMLGMFALLAQFYSDNLASEVSKGRAERARAGLPNGDLPFGYRSAGDPKLPPIVVAEEAEHVRMCFQRYAGGTSSAHEIAGLLNDRGLQPRSKREITRFTKATVTDMLANPFYAGMVRYLGEVLPGKHEPIITEELLEAVQRVRASRRKNPSGLRARPDRIYMLRGIARCVRCGRRLICSPSKGGRRYHDTSKEKHDHCGWGRLSVSALELEENLSQVVRRIALPDDWRTRVLQLVEEAGPRHEVERRRAALKDRLARFRSLFEEGDIPIGKWQTERARVHAELESLAAVVTPFTPLEVSGELLRRYAEVWDQGTEEERAAIARAIFEEVYVDMDAGEVQFVKPRAAFLPLLEVVRREGVLFGDPERPEVSQAKLYSPILEMVELSSVLPIRGAVA